MNLKVLLLTVLISFSWINTVSADAGFDAFQKKDYSEAFRIWKPQADDGDVYAQDGLGVLYFQGYGVLKDVSKGLKWVTKAAEQGHAVAQYRLVVHETNGCIPSFRVDIAEYSKQWCYLSKAKYWANQAYNNKDSRYKSKTKELWDEFHLWEHKDSYEEQQQNKKEKSQTLFDKAKSFF
jgi:TPR repeat protein